MGRAGRLATCTVCVAAMLPVPAVAAQDAAVELAGPSLGLAVLDHPSSSLLPSRLGQGGFERLPAAAPRAPFRRERAGRVSPGRASALSAVLPGAGQHVLGQRRTWAYLAIEAVGWVAYADRRGAGHDLRRAYQDFAWQQARIQSDPRVDGDWEYYETLTQWERSGFYDADPAATGVQPESDPATYNGSIWELATKLFLPGGPGTPPQDPSYQRALAYYAERGYATEFLWDWTGSGGAQAEYIDLISASDRRYRQATNVLGAIIANHAVSAADAFLSARGVSTPSEVRLMPRGTGFGTGWYARVTFGVGG